MVTADLHEFDDEMKIMHELMDEPQIALSDADFEVSVQTINLKRAVTVERNTTIRYCIDLMVARHIGCLIVVENGKLAGMFTERDVLTKIAGQKLNYDSITVDQVMTPHPVALRNRDSVGTAVRLMHGGGYRHVAIVDHNNEPVSVVSIRDIVAYIADFFPQDVLNLPPHPIRIGTKNREGG